MSSANSPAGNVQYCVCYDTREQQPWKFDGRTKGCVGYEKATLKTGDYTVKGLEDILCLERKKSVSELAGNVFEDRFGRELERMRGIPIAYVILEFPFWHVVEYPRVPTVPHSVRSKIKVSGSLLTSKLLGLEADFPWVRWHFAGDRGKDMAAALFRRAARYAAAIGRSPTLPAGKSGAE